jgi:hypothetical protein
MAMPINVSKEHSTRASKETHVLRVIGVSGVEFEAVARLVHKQRSAYRLGGGTLLVLNDYQS